MRPGDKVRVRALKADGQCYRSWETTIEEASREWIVTVSPPGEPVHDTRRGSWTTQHALRAYYWFMRPYNLIEVFEPDGQLVEIYVNIASPVRLEAGGLAFTDHELDVAAHLPGKARLLDEDEFDQAALKYGYSEEFKRRMHAAAAEALRLADRWQARAVPTF